MSCFICDYQRLDAPPSVAPLPAGTGGASREALGTCHHCGISACGQHATRYVCFQCAICTPGQAVLRALSADHDPEGDGPTVELMRQVGSFASKRQLQSVERGLHRIDDDQRRARYEGFTAADDDDFNLVTNLAVVLRQAGADDFVHEVRTADEDAARASAGGLSIDAYAAAVRSQLGDSPLRVDEDAITVGTGALISAMALANEQPASYGLGAMIPTADVEIVAPWQVDRPILLDPIIWALGTAIHI